MFSLQRMFGRDDEFCALFQASAEEACNSISMLKAVFLEGGRNPPTLEAFSSARRNEKRLHTETNDLLIHALVTAMDTEDIEVITASLYRIPKTIEKFAERYSISSAHVRDIPFLGQIDLMDQAARAVLEMIQSWRAGASLKTIKGLNANIQRIEGEADDLIRNLTAAIYQPGYPPLKAIIAKDLFELNEKVVDRCRDAGNTITQVVLKYT
jgi:uncharacterized protein Yka (UPF0111/DUF47 family)